MKEIRQLNLNELLDLDELPIEAKKTALGDDVRVFRDNLEKLKSDPFFLDSDGNEVESDVKFDPGLNKRFDNYDADQSSGGYAHRGKFGFSAGKRNTMNTSSFKSSLSRRFTNAAASTFSGKNDTYASNRKQKGIFHVFLDQHIYQGLIFLEKF